MLATVARHQSVDDVPLLAHRERRHQPVHQANAADQQCAKEKADLRGPAAILRTHLSEHLDRRHSVRLRHASVEVPAHRVRELDQGEELLRQVPGGA